MKSSFLLIPLLTVLLFSIEKKNDKIDHSQNIVNTENNNSEINNGSESINNENNLNQENIDLEDDEHKENIDLENDKYKENIDLENNKHRIIKKKKGGSGAAIAASGTLSLISMMAVIILILFLISPKTKDKFKGDPGKDAEFPSVISKQCGEQIFNVCLVPPLDDLCETLSENFGLTFNELPPTH